MGRFPALYRMPVAYLAAAVVAGLWLGARGPHRREAVSAGSRGVDQVEAPAPASASLPTPTAVETRPEPVPIPASGAILRAADGTRRKAVVRELDVVPRNTPDGDATGPPLDDYAVRFVFGESPTMLHVGPRAGPPEGWVARESVVEWDTRLMARPAPRGSRPALVLYREEACAVAATAGRPCPTHGGRCPTEGEEAPEDDPDAPLGWPVLRARPIPGAGGEPQSLFEVAALVSDRAPPAPRADRLKALRPDLRHVYIAFAIDTTPSMAPDFDAARRLANGLIDRVAREHPDVLLHLAIVEYRDDGPGLGFHARLATRFTEPAGFRVFLNALRPAIVGDASVDEAVLDGVAACLPGASGGVEWPSGLAGELATKLVVLLGDAPDHDSDSARAEALAGRARSASIAIAAVRLDRPGTLSADESARLEAQWRALAEGSYRPADRQGVESPPLVLGPDGAGELSARVGALLDDRNRQARALAAREVAEAEARLQDYVDGRGRTLRHVAPVLVDLHRGEADPAPRPDPRFNGRKAPSVRTGWVAGPSVRIDVLMSRDELDGLIAELAALQQAVSGSAGELPDLLTAGGQAPDTFLATDRGPLTFAEHLRQRFRIPLRPNSLMERTQTDLLRADALDRAALEAKLGAALLGLTRRRNARDWSDPARTADGMGLVPYDTLPGNSLP